MLPYSWTVRIAKWTKDSRLLDAALWASSFVLLVFSLALSWGPPPHFAAPFRWSDKPWHFLGYGGLCETLLLAAVWRPGRGPGSFPRAGRRVALLVLAVAWATEALQAPFGRDVEVTDAVADLAGITLGFVLWKSLPGLFSGRGSFVL
jgi:VanZ family protein